MSFRVYLSQVLGCLASLCPAASFLGGWHGSGVWEAGRLGGLEARRLKGGGPGGLGLCGREAGSVGVLESERRGGGAAGRVDA